MKYAKKMCENLRMCKNCCTFAADLEKSYRRDGGIGRHEGLKILWPVMAVWVQVPLAVQQNKKQDPRGLALRRFFTRCALTCASTGRKKQKPGKAPKQT